VSEAAEELPAVLPAVGVIGLVFSALDGTSLKQFIVAQKYLQAYLASP
jgi:hypothetical protein